MLHRRKPPRLVARPSTCSLLCTKYAPERRFAQACWLMNQTRCPLLDALLLLLVAAHGTAWGAPFCQPQLCHGSPVQISRGCACGGAGHQRTSVAITTPKRQKGERLAHDFCRSLRWPSG
ncbi:hypothetical protein M3J09_007862 [Ascochyta lentis]